MDLAIQTIANDKTLKSDTVEDLKRFTHNLYQHKLKKENN